jgi:broad specificity polyphosphatase/5'/3'-nucleotidase SurE
MARVVVVATTPPDRETLAEHLDPADEVFVVAPAVEQSRLAWLANDEDDARATARAVGETVAAEAPAEAAAVEVKPDPPLQVVRDAIAEHDPDRILAVVRRGEESTWLEDGDSIPDAIDGVPVTVVQLDT